MSSQEVLSPLERLTGRSEVMRGIRERIRRIARAPVPVLVLGETGTGKELCARAIARLSGRKPYVAVNCAAFPESLIDSELFGYEKGAFTGAHRDRPGLIAKVDGGVLFLDELAETSPAVQAKLLRTLESGEYRPVGSSATRTSQFRIIAATSDDLDGALEDGRLRPDLVFRLGAMRLVLPPLRQRPEDLPGLSELFLTRYRQRAGGGPDSISADALMVLQDHPWPGNVRELRNVIEASAALAGQDSTLRATHVAQVFAPSDAPHAARGRTVPTLAEVIERAERRAVMTALTVTNANRQEAARILGISAATLYRKLAQFRDPVRGGEEEGGVRASQG